MKSITWDFFALFFIVFGILFSIVLMSGAWRVGLAFCILAAVCSIMRLIRKRGDMSAASSVLILILSIVFFFLNAEPLIL